MPSWSNMQSLPFLFWIVVRLELKVQLMSIHLLPMLDFMYTTVGWGLPNFVSIAKLKENEDKMIMM